jgi:hypothetical protein
MHCVETESTILTINKDDGDVQVSCGEKPDAMEQRFLASRALLAHGGWNIVGVHNLQERKR